MGWTYIDGATRADVICELTRREDSHSVSAQVIAHALRGNVLWTVCVLTAKHDSAIAGLAAGQSTRFIGCNLLARDSTGWGYKDMAEAVHPYYYTCPLSYLDMAPEASHSWRAGVRAYHASGCRDVARQAADAALEQERSRAVQANACQAVTA
ncbi:MAG: hypothetical protein LBH10_05705 [Burkholderiaceae bacterium]|jgi:hypothetical protein|nr:hypothetical protein [Burkholderiaceae bacterium]